jgi:hypothetical protein
VRGSGFFAAVLRLFAALPLAAQVEFAAHGSVETLQAVPFSHERSLTDSRNIAAGEIGFSAGPAAAFVSLAAEYNAVSPGRSGFSLGEAWVDWSRGGLSFRLGRQLVSWGVADGLTLADVVCPQNLSAYAGLDFAGSRLAVDGLRLRYAFPALAFEALWIPLFTPARLPEDPGPLYEIFYPSSIDAGPAVLPVSFSAASLPRTIADGEYGLRVSCYTPALDFSVMGFYGWNDIPFFTKQLIPGGGLNLTPEYGRTLSAGADAGIPLGEVLLRLEAVWTAGGRYERPAGETAVILFSGERENPLEKDNLRMLAGLDWNPRGWALSAQYYEDLIPGAYNGGLERPWRKNALTLRVSRGFFREILTLSAWCFLDLKDFDSTGSVSAGYALTDFLSLSLGGSFFTGGIDGRGSYEAYRDLSCLWVRGIFRF